MLGGSSWGAGREEVEQLGPVQSVYFHITTKKEVQRVPARPSHG